MALLFIGYRKDAISAARRLGQDVRLLFEPSTRLPEKFRSLHYRHIDFGSPDTQWIELALDMFPNDKPQAIVALTEKGVVPAATLREALGIKGISGSTAQHAHDKLSMKHSMKDAGIPCAEFMPLTSKTPVSKLIDALGLPLVIKPRNSSGSRGTRIVDCPQEMTSLLQDDFLAERFIAGRELSIETFISNGKILLENITEYLIPGWANIVPAEPFEQQEEVLALNRRLINHLNIFQGMTHCEIFLTEDGPLVGEIAVRPPGGYIMELLSTCYAFDAWESFLKVEMGQHPSLPRRPESVMGVQLLHPGEGIFKRLDGLDQARAVPNIIEVRCRLKPGDRISPRVGVGQSVGRIVARADSHASIREALQRAESFLTFEFQPSIAP